MPLASMAHCPCMMERMKAQWASHAGQDLTGLVGLGADMGPPREKITMGPPAPWQELVSAQKAKKQTKDKSGGGTSALDWFNAVTKSITEVAPVFRKQKAAKGGGFEPGPQPTGFDWQKWALIGGGVLIAGVATVAIVKAVRKKKGK